MKTNSPLGHLGGGVALVLSVASLSGELKAQQAPQYAYPPQGYGQQAPAYAPSAQQYQTPPGYPGSGYQARQGYPQQGYPPQGYSQPPQRQYVSPAEFLPTFGRKFGDMFRKVFYGDAPPPGYQGAPPGYPAQRGGNLDTPPPSYGSHYGTQPPPGYAPPPPSYPQQTYPQQAAPQQSYPPRYETPPPPMANGSTRAPASSLPPSSRSNSGAATAPRTATPKKAATTPAAPSKKYTPPTLSRETPAPRQTTPQMEELPPETSSSPSPAYTPKTAETTEPYRLPGSKPSATTPTESKGGNATASSGSFLKGKKASKAGRVISPYPPYQELDVTGLSSGSLALDPTTQKVFEVP